MQIAENANIVFPNWQNIRDTFKITPFQETEKGEKLINQWDKNVKISQWIKKIGFIIIPVIFILVLIENGTDHWFSAIIASGLFFLPIYIVYKIYQKTIVKITQDRYYKGRDAFTVQLADTLLTFFGGSRYIFNNAHCFVFNSDMCIYVNANEGSWVGFHQQNIKDVELERVNLGSTTISNTQSSGSAYAWTNNFATYSGSSTTVSTTTNHFEFRLDIYTFYTDYPHITVVFPDNSDGEQYAKKAKALLKPVMVHSNFNN